MIRMRHLMAACAVAALAACASAPVHYYTLMPAPDGSPSDASGPPAAFQFELMQVGVPAHNDVPQLVIRQGGQSVDLLGDQRWVAPLADEVRGALSVDLARRMHATDISGGVPASGKPVLRIKVDLRRFDSVPGSFALIDATWTVRELRSQAVLTCSSRFSENVGQGYAELVSGHQRALAALADRIAGVAPAMAAGSVPACP